MTVVRADSSGSSALILCNFRGDVRSVPVPRSDRRWTLVLWNGGPRYGGPAPEAAPPAILDENDLTITLGRFGGALYIADNRR
jgi:hypothetical protein